VTAVQGRTVTRTTWSVKLRPQRPGPAPKMWGAPTEDAAVARAHLDHCREADPRNAARWYAEKKTAVITTAEMDW
jgi:hypothetical protein